MFNQLTPLRIFWGKILPISYDNYLSETEILEYLRKKVNEVTNIVNQISNFLENDLPSAISEQVKIEIENYMSDITSRISDIEKSISDLENELADLENEVNQKIDELSILMDDRFKNMEEYIDDQLSLYVAQLESEIQTLMSNINELSSKIDFFTAYVDKEIGLEHLKQLLLLQRMYKNITAWVSKYFSQLSSTEILVNNPDTGLPVTLQEMLNILDSRWYTPLTALEYDRLGLTAEEYDNLGLTAWQYDHYGIFGKTAEKENLLTDMFGNLVRDPVPSVYSAICQPLEADMGLRMFGEDLSLTAEEWDELIAQYDAKTFDQYGAYIFSNLQNSVFFDNIKITGNQTTTNDSATVEIRQYNGLTVKPKQLMNGYQVKSYISATCQYPSTIYDGTLLDFKKGHSTVTGNLASVSDTVNERIVYNATLVEDVEPVYNARNLSFDNLDVDVVPGTIAKTVRVDGISSTSVEQIL